MCENFNIGVLSLEPVCLPQFCLISSLFTEGHGDSPFITYTSFQVLLLFSSPEESHHSSLSSANSVICCNVTSDKSEKGKR